MHKFLLVMLMCFLLSSSAVANEKKEEADKRAEALERRQKVELLSFFSNPSKDSELKGTAFSVQLFNQAVEHFNKQEMELARQSCKEALKHDDTNALAYELLGDIDYFQQNLKDAKENYQIAYALRPDISLDQKIQKLTRENQVEQKLSTYTEEHFIIKYHDSEKNAEGYQLKEMLRDAYKSISQDLSFYFKHQVVVLLYDEDEYRQVTNAPHWAGGIYDGKVRMPLRSKGFGAVELKALTHHEVTHAFVALISKGSADPWINEGLAVYEENRVKKYDLTVFNAAIKTGTMMPLKNLISQSGLESIQDALAVKLFYEQSFHFVTYLVSRYGMYRVKEMLEVMGSGKTSDQAVQDILKISVDRLEREWKDSFIKASR